MNLKVFFDNVRGSVFAGGMSQEQVDGCIKIIEYRDEHWPNMVNAELAYLLATSEWETAHTMRPVEEGHPLTGNALRNYQKKLRYYPWYGRGFVQITWEKNYQKFGIEKPEDALQLDVALRVLFEGCIKGVFTEHKLSDYITDKRQDYVGARNVVNGQDQAARIAKNAKAFHAALLKAATAPIVEKPEPITVPAIRPVPLPVPVAVPSMWDRIVEALDKLGAQPLPAPPAPASIPSPALIATPSPEFLAVANRIEQRQIEMLEMLKALAADVAALKIAIAQVRTHVDDLRGNIAEKEAAIVVATETMTPEQQAQFDAIKAETADALKIATEAAAA